MTLARVQRLTELAAARGLPAVAIVPGPNMKYFTGLSFHLSERPIVAIFSAGETPAIIVPVLEADKPLSAPFDMQIFVYTDEAGAADAFWKACASLKLRGVSLGVEGRRMRVLEAQFFEEFAKGTRLEQAEPVIAQLRMKKDEHELAMMRQAVDIAQRALTATLPFIKVGVSEREISSELQMQLLRAGTDEMPFQPIIASGENGAVPHAFVTERKIQKGDLITIDWGASVDGYFSDLTRTYAVGKIDPELRRVYDAVKEANAAGRAAAKPGGTGQDVDRAARAVIDKAGFGEYFTHRTGHGLGLEGHEEPDMKEGETMPLEPGMTFTVEPGIYLTGKSGVRIEDDMVITESGAESLTTLPREMIRLD